MSYTTRDTAIKKAERVERRLVAKGFPITSKRVWDNCGWHWAVSVGGYASVSETSRGGYMCLISDGTYVGVGECFWSPRGVSSRTPEAALRCSMKAVVAFANKIAPVVELCRAHVK